jgi:hypothetical protein
MRQAMTDEMRANGLMLAAAFFYSGGIIGVGIWRGVADATTPPQP